MNTLANVTSVVTPVEAPIGTMTKDQAIAAAFKYGQSLAGIDGTLSQAIKQFKTDTAVLSEIQTALNVGYVMKTLKVSKGEAERIVGLMKHNEKKAGDDAYRTFEQERVMVAARVAWSRAKAMAGVPKSETAAKGEATRAKKEADRKEHEARLIKADEIVNPKDDVDAFDAIDGLITTLKNMQKKYANKLTGDRGAKYRDWIASAPKAK